MSADIPSDFKYLHTPNRGAGAARKLVIVFQANGSIFIPVDTDNLPVPHMVHRFSEVMAFRPSLTARRSCFLGKLLTMVSYRRWPI